MKFRYRNEDEMKDSGIDIVGNIPNGWKVGKAQYYFNVYSGGTPSTNKSSYWDGNIPWINSGEVQNGIVKNISKYITESGLKESSTKLIPKNTTLLAMTGSTCGKVGYLTFDSAANQSVMAFTEPKNCNSKFLFYYLLCQNNQVEYFKTGGAQGGINVDNGKKFYVNIPSNIEQEKIAKFLDEKTVEFDSVISKKEALIEKLEEAKKSLISEVVTGKVKVVKTSDGYELVQRKKEEMKNSGVEWLGEIPKEWKITKLKLKTIQVNRGKSPEYVEESKIKVINQACIYWDCFNLKNVKYQNEINLGERGKLYKNDILINSTGTGTLGRANIFKEDGNFIADSHVTIIRCKDKSFADYLKYVFRTDLYQGLIYSTMVTGSTNQIELSREGLRNMIVLDISNEELNLINNILEDKINKINLVIDKTKSEIEKLKEAKQSLISEAVTGKIEILE
ncbi:restriction endonuclease subunit S [Clostridium perfringens]|uniref:restriction endonuclease subunit S n=1 Tax=Clostridium perfringens TaxID=1502 RepID=UPI0023672F36|nr:restriction endonuclease subunit S [Clostridium perfringens]EJT6159070.1 restriction endonuclease subunit S [Clostridium perfringens]